LPFFQPILRRQRRPRIRVDVALTHPLTFGVHDREIELGGRLAKFSERAKILGGLGIVAFLVSGLGGSEIGDSGGSEKSRKGEKHRIGEELLSGLHLSDLGQNSSVL